MRALLVVNPQATATTSGGRDVLAHALASDCELRVVHTAHRGHATELAAAACAEADLVIAHGGDGTVNEVVNGLLGDGQPPAARRPALAVVPGGAANVFARALGVPRDPVEATHLLLQALEAGRERTVGLGRVSGRWFTFNAGIGWDADVVRRVEAVRSKSVSQARYATTALSSYARQVLQRPRLAVEVAGSEPVEAARTVFVSNTDPWSYLGNRPIRLNPGSSFDGGLGVLALRSMWAPAVLRFFAQAVRKKADPHGPRLLRSDDVPLVRVSSVKSLPLQVDGDHIGTATSVDFMAVPEALRVIV